MKLKILLLIITLLGLLLRLFRLGYHDLWFDEAISIFFSGYYQRLWNPPLFYAILHLWIKLFGQSEFSVRFPALIFSTLSIPSIFLLAKSLFNPRIGVIAAAIIALSPMHLWYAQEARPHSVVLLFSITSTYFLIRAIRGKTIYWIYFIISSILGLYAGELYIFLLICHVVIFTIHVLFNPEKGRIKNFLLPLLLISLCFLPWISRYLYKLRLIQKGFWIPQPDIFSLMITFKNFLIGYNLSQNYYLIVFFLILILLLATCRSIYADRNARSSFYICLFLAAFPIIAIYIFSKLIVSIYLDRSLIMFSPYYYILLAIGIKSLFKRKMGFVVHLALCFLFIVGIKSFYQDHMPMPLKHHMGTYIKKPIKPLVEFIEKNLRPEDIIAFTNHSTQPSFVLYANDKTRNYYDFFDPELYDTDWNRPIEEDEYYIPKQKISLLKTRRIWVIASNWRHDGELDEQSKSIKEYLDKEMTLSLAKNIHGKWVYLYERR